MQPNKNATLTGETVSAAKEQDGRLLNSSPSIPRPIRAVNTHDRYYLYLALADQARAGIMPAERRGDWPAVRRYKRRCATFGILAARCRRVLLTAGGEV